MFFYSVAFITLINYNVFEKGEWVSMGKHIKTVNKARLSNERDRGCGECQTSCQSACKTSCTVSNQLCVREQSK